MLLGDDALRFARVPLVDASNRSLAKAQRRSLLDVYAEVSR
jgi:hypothetical protein